MSRPVFSFRPNLEYPEHQRAWEILKNVPEGQKNLFLVQAILQKDQAQYIWLPYWPHMHRKVCRHSVFMAMTCRLQMLPKFPQT